MFVGIHCFNLFQLMSEPSNTNNDAFNLGLWHVDPANNALSRPRTEEQVLRPKIMQVLQLLAQNESQLVSREQLIEEVWEGNQYVGEKGITDAIWHLRKVLDQDEQNAPYIQTIPKKGYRLLVTPESSNVTQEAPSKKPNTVMMALSAAIIIGLVITILMQHFNSGGQNNTAKKTPKVEAITALPGNELSPAISPDGKYLAYTHHTSGQNYDLHVTDLTQEAGSRQHFKVNDGFSAAYGAWSQDGKRLAFASRSSLDECEINIMEMVTRKISKVTDCSSNYIVGLDWSSDGKYMLFGTRGEDESGIISLYNLDTKELRPLTVPSSDDKTFDMSMRISPSGKNVAFVRHTRITKREIYLVSLDGEQRQLTDAMDGIAGLYWIDDENLLYSNVSSNKATLHKLNILTNEVEDVLPNEVDAAFPSYSSESNTLVYRKRSMAKALYVLDVEPKANQVRIKPFFRSPSVDFYPNYSATAEKFAIVSDRSGQDEVWITDKDGGGLQQITDLKTKIFSPAWSPDGTKIAFTAAQKGKRYTQIFVYDTSDQSIKMLTKEEFDHAPPTWSRDSKHLYVGVNESGEFRLWKYDLEGNGQALINGPSIYAYDKPNEDRILYTEMGQGGIWQYNPEDDSSELLLETNSRIDGSNWLTTEQGIFFVMRTDDSDVINFYDYASASQETVVILPKNTITGFDTLTYKPETNQLIFVQNFRHEADIYAVRNIEL